MCVAVMSEDPARWVRPTREAMWDAHRATWPLRVFRSTSEVNGLPGDPIWNHHSFPPTPPSPSPGDEVRSSECPPPDPPPPAEEPRSCEGALCLRDQATIGARAGNHHWALLWDGRCLPADTNGYGGCRPGAPMVRLPHVAAIDIAARKVVVGELPAGCQPHRLVSARGLGLLLCGDDRQTQMWSKSHGTPWQRELSHPTGVASIREVSIAADGTLIVRLACNRRCGALLRQPTAAGATARWSHMQLQDALTYRPVVGGKALVARSRDPGAVTLALVDAGGRTDTLTTAAVSDALNGLRVGLDGSIHLLLGDEERLATPSFEGTLEPVGSSSGATR